MAAPGSMSLQASSHSGPSAYGSYFPKSDDIKAGPGSHAPLTPLSAGDKIGHTHSWQELTLVRCLDLARPSSVLVLLTLTITKS